MIPSLPRPVRRGPQACFRAAARGRGAASLLLGLLGLFVLLLGGCAVRQPQAVIGGAAATWRAYQASLPQTPATGMLASSSLAWRSGKKSARLVLDLWGDFDGPLRMDVWSNLGGNVCHFVQDAEGLVAYYPGQSKAYAHADPIMGARRLGLPFPFALDDLAALLAGRYRRLAPDVYASAEPGPGGGWIYRFDAAAGTGRVDALALDGQARPLYMEGRLQPLPGAGEDGEKADAAAKGGVWRIAFTHYRDADATADEDEALPMLPDRLTVTMPGDTQGVLRVKTRRLESAPWAESAMRLKLPAGTLMQELDNVPRDWTTGRARTEEGPEAAPAPAPEPDRAAP